MSFPLASKRETRTFFVKTMDAVVCAHASDGVKSNSALNANPANPANPAKKPSTRLLTIDSSGQA